MNKFVTILLLLVPLVMSQQEVGSIIGDLLNPDCVQYVNPVGAISTTGTWSISSRVLRTDCVPLNIAGMRGITPNNNTQVSLTQPNGLYLRVKQAFLNMIYNAEQLGARAKDCSRVVVFVRDMVSIRPVVNRVQTEIWGAATSSNPIYPPRTILQIDAFNGLTCEYGPQNWRQGTAGANGQVVCENGGTPIGDILEVEGTFYVRRR
ncbi:hypothetical protein AKO1_009787 [Acrasis kona]|uniref:Uncharacterized protein n=1 Tax=Acrasis kona TaxID=1008807 RepID=A0AAW2ZP33_9EUKA